MESANTSIDHYRLATPSFWKRAVDGSFRGLQILFDIESYARDRAAKIEDMLDKKIGFFLAHDINKDPEIDDVTREKYFGTTHVTASDITWEKLDKILMPARVPNAVYRVNDALEGSDYNYNFSCNMGSSAFYTPRTVTVYENEQSARFAAKMLRIITRDAGRSKNSAATIIAEEISNGVERQWVVSDNMNLHTHNNIRRVFSHLYGKIKDENKKAELDIYAQKEVDARLPESEKPWDAWKGVGTFLTLAGRPGVKMYAKLKDENGDLVYKRGKALDDPNDVAHLSYLPNQPEMRLTLGIPDSILKTADGRPFEFNSAREVRMRAMMGQRFYSLITKGTYRASGELLNDDLRLLKEKGFSDGSPFGVIASLPSSFMGLLGMPEELVTKYLGIALGAITIAPLLAVTSAGNWAYNSFKEHTGSDPLNENLRPAIEKLTGINTRSDAFHKVWTHRQPQKNEPQIEKLAEPADIGECKWQEFVTTNRSWGERFFDHAQQKNFLPDAKLYKENAAVSSKIEAYYVSAANFVFARKFDASTLAEKKEAASTALKQLRNTINEMPNYNGGLHNKLLNQITDNLKQGLSDFVQSNKAK